MNSMCRLVWIVQNYSVDQSFFHKMGDRLSSLIILSKNVGCLSQEQTKKHLPPTIHHAVDYVLEDGVGQSSPTRDNMVFVLKASIGRNGTMIS